MRVNIYAEEMTERVEIIGKEIDGRTFTGLRLYLELPVTLPGGENFAGPFMHRPGDDDSAAITFWGKRDLRVVLRKMLAALDAHYTKAQPPAEAAELIASTESEKHLAFEWLRHTALESKNGRTSRYAAIMMSEIARMQDQQPVRGRYLVPLQLLGGKTADLQVRFVAREHIKNKPTEANLSPMRVLLVGDIEQAQSSGVAHEAEP